MTVATMPAMIDWNQWRSDYDRMSFAEHQAFNAEAAVAHPEQRCWNGDACARFLAERNPRTVVELGGWDGSLADAMLTMFDDIDTWLNIDITPNVPQACAHDDYLRSVLHDWPWNLRVSADVLVASHVFEHMRMPEVEKLLDAWNVRSVYVDCPISAPSDWHGYSGSHILEVGATEFLARLADRGWTVSHSEPGLVAFLDRSGL